MSRQVLGGIFAAIDGGGEVISLVFWGQVNCAGAHGRLDVLEARSLLLDLLEGGYTVDVDHGGCSG